MKPIRVVLADDHALVRAGIRSLLQNIDGVQVVAETSDGREAVTLVKKHKPDLALLDISMAGLNGLEAALRIHKEVAATRVLILSMHTNEEYVLRALRLGVAGYLVKEAAPIELELAVRTVTRGDIYLSPAISKHLLTGYLHSPPHGGAEASGPSPSSAELLTPRQREILQLIAEGLSTKEIAARLQLSVKTAETHRMQLMERLDIHNVAGLVRYAIGIGLVELGR